MSHRRQEPRSRIRPRWRSTVRELLTAGVAFLPLAVMIGRELELEDRPEVAGTFAVVVALSAALHSPAGRVWSARYLSGGRDATPDDPPESGSRP